MDNYVVFSKDKCSYCQAAKNLLLMRGANFVVMELDENYSLKEFQERFPTAKTFPAIEKNGLYIGGYEQLKGML